MSSKKNSILVFDVEAGSYATAFGGITIYEQFKDVYNAQYYTIEGSKISDDTYISLSVEYSYNNGQLCLGDKGQISYPLIDKEIRIVVEDNSVRQRRDRGFLYVVGKHVFPARDSGKALSHTDKGDHSSWTCAQHHVGVSSRFTANA